MKAIEIATAVLLSISTLAPQQAFAQKLGKRLPGSRTSGEAQQEQGQNEASLEDQALGLLARWRHEAARSMLEGASGAPVARAVLLWEEGKADQAAEQLRARIQQEPSDYKALYYLGEILYSSDNSSEASSWWKKAEQKAAGSQGATALYYLGAARVRTKKFAEAREALDQAVQKGFDRAMVLYQKGLSFAFEGKWSDAVSAFTSCIQLDDSYAHAYYWRGLCQEKLGNTEAMLEDLDRFVQLAPDAPEADRAKAVLRAAGR